MKKRQRDKVLKRAGIKLHGGQELTSLEKAVCSISAESKVCSALSEFHTNEYDAGTLYGNGYFGRLTEVMRTVGTIESVTGVKK